MQTIANKKAVKMINLCGSTTSIKLIDEIILPSIGSESDIMFWKEVKNQLEKTLIPFEVPYDIKVVLFGVVFDGRWTTEPVFGDMGVRTYRKPTEKIELKTTNITDGVFNKIQDSTYNNRIEIIELHKDKEVFATQAIISSVELTDTTAKLVLVLISPHKINN